MASDAFRKGMIELYQGEILGEVFFGNMLSYFGEPDRQYKIAVMLQQETETKARLRPAMMLLGLDLAEQDEYRAMGLKMASALKGLDWLDAMAMIRDAVRPFVVRYKEIAADAPPEHQELADSMVVHEQSIFDCAEFELAGEGQTSVDTIAAQLNTKLPSP